MRRIFWGFLASLLLATTAQADIADHLRAIKRNAKDAFKQRERESAIRKLGDMATIEAADALMPLFEDPFVHIHDHVVSAWIRMLRKNRTGELHTWFEGAALRTKLPNARVGAVVAMCLSSGPELADAVRDSVRTEKEARVQEAWARYSRQLRGSPALEGVFVPALSHKDADVVYEAALAVAAFDGEAGAPALRKAYRHKRPRARGGIAEALARSGALSAEDIERILADKSDVPRVALALSTGGHAGVLPWPGRGEEVCKSLLADPSWRVRVAAIQGALQAWNKQWIHLAIGRLKEETDPRVRDDLHRGLITYTQLDVGADADLWISWWAANGERFVPGERPEPDKAGRIRWRKPLHDVSKGGTKTVVFFDVPLRTARVAFVFDLSGSMRDKSGDGKTKMDLLRAQFEETLKGLPKGTRFDLVVYRYPSGFPPKPKLTRALGKLQPFSRKTAAKAAAWLAKQEPKGWGAFQEPLEALLAEEVDTIVLLSDGRPSRGKLDRDFRILQEFPRTNRLRQVQINTVLVGTKGADRKFMEELAEATGGRFKAVDN